MFFVHQLHTYLPLIDLSFHGYIVVILQIESESIKKYQSALGDHNLILLSNFLEKEISFIKVFKVLIEIEHWPGCPNGPR